MTSCHDNQCAPRHRCQRWRTRDSAEPGTQHAMTLKAAWMPHTARCERYRWAQGVEPLLESGPAGWLAAAWLMGGLPADVHLGSLERAD